MRIRRWLEEHHIFWHVVNDNRSRTGQRKGSAWREGRFFLHLGARRVLHLEWRMFKRTGIGFSVDVGGEENDLTFGLRLRWFLFYAGAEGFVSSERKYRKWMVSKSPVDIATWETGVSLHDGYINIHLWSPETGDSRYDKRHWMINVPDLLLGSTKYSKETLRTERAIIPMPEGPYPTTVTLHRSTWRRPRWPWPRVGYYANVKPDKPVPFEGKGENSWDMGEDATHEMSVAAETADQAVAAFVARILSRRAEYGIPASIEAAYAQINANA